MANWKWVVAGFCIPINIFLIITGILIDSPRAIVAAVACIGLVSTPLIQEYYEKKDEKEDSSK